MLHLFPKSTTRPSIPFIPETLFRLGGSSEASGPQRIMRAFCASVREPQLGLCADVLLLRQQQ